MTKRLVMVGMLVAVAAVGLRAQGPGGPPMGPPPGPPGLGMLRQLQLTDAQKSDVQGIMQEAQPSMQASRQKLDQARRALMAAIFADAPDAGAVAASQEAVSAAEQQALSAEVALQQRIAQILTPEQRLQARQAPRMGQRPPGPPRGPRNGQQPPQN